MPSRIAWALRKVLLPIQSSDLVLDVGSGGNPHPAADIILDKYIDPVHRQGAVLRSDRPFVVADAAQMPFRDKAFDYVVAFHVLEHVRNPEAFLMELQRVGRAGYIETPNALFERFVPYDIHLLEIMEIEGRLIIHKKACAHPDPFLNGLALTQKIDIWSRFFRRNPRYFHVQHFWRNRISFSVVNPETSLEWFKEPEVALQESDTQPRAAPKFTLRSLGLQMFRQYYKLRKPRKLQLNSLLVCVNCRGQLEEHIDALICKKCKLSFALEPYPNFCRATVLS